MTKRGRGLPKRMTLEGLTSEQITELAQSYLDLLNLMNEALEECETGWGFFEWSGRGYNITGHPPHEVVEALLLHPREAGIEDNDE